MRKYLDYTGLQTLVDRIKSCYMLEIGVSGGTGAIMVDNIMVITTEDIEVLFLNT